MSIIIRFVFKNIRTKIKSSILIFFLLTFLSVIVYNCIGIDKNVYNKYYALLSNFYGNCDISVKNSNIDEVMKLLENDGIECDAINVDMVVRTFYSESFPEEGKQFIVLNTDYLKAYNLRIFPNVLLEGDNVALTESDLVSLGLSVGEVIRSYDGSGNEIKFTVYSDIENTRFFSSEGKIPFMAVSDSLWEKLDHSSASNIVYLDIPDEMIERSFSVLSENGLETVKLVDKKVIKESSSSVRKMFWIILAFVFLICFFIINAISHLIDYERKEAIGTFRSVGATVEQTVRVFLIENAIFGFGAGIIGGIIAVLTEDIVSALFGFVSVAGMERQSFGVIFLKFMITVATTIILNIFMSVSLIYKQCRREIKEIIIEKKEKKYEASFVAFIVGIAMIVSSIVIIANGIEINLIGNIIILILSILGLSLSLPYFTKIISVIAEQIIKKLRFYVLYVSNSNLRSSAVIINNIRVVCVLSMLMLTINIVSNSFASFFTAKADIYNCDFVVSEMSSEDEVSDLENSLDNDENAEWNAFFSNKCDISVNSGELFNAVIISDWKKEELGKFFDGIKYDNNGICELNDQEIIIDKTVCKKFNLKKGSTVKIAMGSGKEREYSLVDMCSSELLDNNNVFVIPHNEYARLYGNIPASIFIRTDEKHLSNIMNLINLHRSSVDTKIINVREYKEKEYSENKEMVAIVDFIMLIAMGLAVICIVSNQFISFYQRKRELAVLYSTSMGNGQIMRMLFYESLLSVIVSAFFAAAGVVLSIHIVERMITMLGIRINIENDLLKIILGVLAIGLIVVIASLLPISRIKKFDVIKAIKYE